MRQNNKKEGKKLCEKREYRLNQLTSCREAEIKNRELQKEEKEMKLEQKIERQK